MSVRRMQGLLQAEKLRAGSRGESRTEAQEGRQGLGLELAWGLSLGREPAGSGLDSSWA